MDPKTEQALIARLQDRDTTAFDAIHAEFNGRLFTFLLRLSRRRDVAEDLLEETWLRLVKHAARLRADTRLGPWLFTVARNLHVSYRRAQLLDESATASLMALWPFSVAHPSPFEEAAAGEFERRVQHALSALPAASREVLLLVSVARLDASEAARVCGISADAFRHRLSRARAMLARALENERRGPRTLAEVTP